MSTQAYKENIKKAIYLYKLIVSKYLHFWPAGDPLICAGRICLASGGPDQRRVPSSVVICAAVVSVGVAPRVDKDVGCWGGIYHSGFGFEVAFGARGN